LSLKDQEDNGRGISHRLYPGPTEFTVIATKGKGERLDRPELEVIEALYRSGEYDLVIYDDLSRLIRGAYAVVLLGIGVDHGTRTYCINDGIDTADDTWEVDALNACCENVAHNERTSRRIKQKLKNRFEKFGGAPSRPIFGYIVPEGAKTYDEWLKDPLAEPFIMEGARLLRATLNGNVVADYFNAHNVPTGPYCKADRWTGTLVMQFYRNELLKGMPFRCKKHTVKNNETGRRDSTKNPQGPVYYPCPHLAYFEAAEFDDLVAQLADHNAHFRRKPIDGVDPRYHVPRKRTRFPGQHGRCWYCGRTYNWGGSGIKNHLMCSGSDRWQCWNSIHIDGPLVVDRIMKAITDELYQLQHFDDQFREIVGFALRDRASTGNTQLQQLETAEKQLAREKENFLNAIAKLGPQPMLEERLADINRQVEDVARRRYMASKANSQPLVLPSSTEELRQLLEAQFQPLNTESPEFGMLLRQIVPEMHVYLVQLLDGGHPLPRAIVQLKLGGIIEDTSRVPELENLLTRRLTIDLFEPPQREQIRVEAVRLVAEGLTQRQAGARLPGQPRQAAVQAALALHREMIQRGLDRPYIMLDAPPENYPKLRRHKNPRYQFEPLEGYQPPQL